MVGRCFGGQVCVCGTFRGDVINKEINIYFGRALWPDLVHRPHLGFSGLLQADVRVSQGQCPAALGSRDLLCSHCLVSSESRLLSPPLCPCTVEQEELGRDRRILSRVVRFSGPWLPLLRVFLIFDPGLVDCQSLINGVGRKCHGSSNCCLHVFTSWCILACSVHRTSDHSADLSVQFHNSY